MKMFSDLPPSMQEVIANLLHAGDFVGAKVVYDRYLDEKEKPLFEYCSEETIH